jgi:hypothetical protein
MRSRARACLRACEDVAENYACMHRDPAHGIDYEIMFMHKKRPSIVAHCARCVCVCVYVQSYTCIHACT